MLTAEQKAARAARLAALPSLALVLQAQLSTTRVATVEGTRWSAFLARVEAASKIQPGQWFYDDEDEEEESEESGYRVTSDGTAIVPIYGLMLDTEPAWWLSYFGATSTIQVTRWMEQAKADANVKRVMLDIDSPGGQASGIATLADATFETSASGKPVWAMCREACSAAYWIASQADRRIARREGMIGCIGTLFTLGDWSKYYSSMGVEILRITSSGAETYKGEGARGTEITDEQKADLKRICDEFQSLFDAGVARGLGMPVEEAHALADGRSFLGYVAQGMGLVEEIGDPDAILARFGEEGGAKDPAPEGEEPIDHEESRRKGKYQSRAALPKQSGGGDPDGKSPGHARTGGRDMTLKERILAAFKGGTEGDDEKLEEAAGQIATLTEQNKKLQDDLATIKAGQQSEQAAKLTALRTRAEAAAKTKIAAASDPAALEIIAEAFEQAAKVIASPTAQTNAALQTEERSDADATVYDTIRKEVAEKYSSVGGYAGKTLKKEGN
jgi:ClpP class serine protease